MRKLELWLKILWYVKKTEDARYHFLTPTVRASPSIPKVVCEASIRASGGLIMHTSYILQAWCLEIGHSGSIPQNKHILYKSELPGVTHLHTWESVYQHILGPMTEDVNLPYASESQIPEILILLVWDGTWASYFSKAP